MADGQRNTIIGIDVDAASGIASVKTLHDSIGNLGENVKTDTFVSLKTQIKAATVEAQQLAEQFGRNSSQFAEAAQNVANLKDKFEDTNTVIKSFNPDNKLQGLIGVASGAAIAVQGVAGAFTALGVSTDDAQVAVAKLQGIMAFTNALGEVDKIKNSFQGLGGVIQSTTAFQKANAVATTVTSVAMKALGISAETSSLGFKVLKGAIIGTGIGALVIGLIALVQNFDDVKKAVLNLIPGLGKVTSFIGSVVNAVTDFVGATSEAERQTKKLIDTIDTQLKKEQEFLDANGDKYDEFTRGKIQADIDYKTKRAEILKDETKSETEKLNLIKQYREKRDREIDNQDSGRAKKQKEDNENQVKEEKEKNDKIVKDRQEANKKSVADAKKAKDDADQAEKDRLSKEKEKNEAITRVRLQAITDELFKKQAQIDIDLDAELEKNQELLNKKLITQKEFDAARLGLIKDAQKKQSDLVIGKEKEDAEAIKKIKLDAAVTNVTNTETNVIRTTRENAPDKDDSIEKAITKIRNINKAEIIAEDAAFAEKKIKADGNNAEIERITEEHLTKIVSINQSAIDKIAAAEETAAADKKAKIDAQVEIANQTLSSLSEIQTAFDDAKLEKELARLGSDEKAKQEVREKYAANAQFRQQQWKAAELKIEKAAADGKVSIMEGLNIALTTASAIAGKNTAAGKALAVAAATIDTIQTGVSAFKGMVSSVPGPVGIALGVVAAAAAVASGYASIKKILAVKVPNAADAAPAPPAPTAPTIDTTVLNLPQGTQDVRVTNEPGQTVIKAYITNDDLNSNADKQNFYNKLSSY